MVADAPARARQLPDVRVTSVTLQGFKGYRRAHTVGPFSGFSVVAGANGMGKSSAVEGIGWALCGDALPAAGSGGGRKSALASALAVIAHGESRAEVTVHFGIKNKRMSIRRVVTITGKGATTAEDENGAPGEQNGQQQKVHVELSIQRAGERGWSSLSASELGSLLAEIGLHACARGAGGAGAGGKHDGLPFYLSQGNSATLLLLPAFALFARVERTLIPRQVHMAEACAADTALAHAAAAKEQSRVEERRQALDDAQPLLAQVRTMLRARCVLLARKLKLLRTARKLHASWLSALDPVLRDARSNERDSVALETAEASAHEDAKRSLLAARSAMRAHERDCADSAAHARLAAARCTEAQRALAAAERAAAAKRERLLAAAKRRADRQQALSSLGDALEAARAARDDARKRASALELQLSERLMYLGLSSSTAADTTTGSSARHLVRVGLAANSSDPSGKHRAARPFDSGSSSAAVLDLRNEAQAEIDDLDRKLWALATAAAAVPSGDELDEESEEEEQAQQLPQQQRLTATNALATSQDKAEEGDAVSDAAARASAAAAQAARMRAHADAARTAAADAASRAAAELARVRAADDALRSAASARARAAHAAVTEPTPESGSAREQLTRALVRASRTAGLGAPSVHGSFRQVAWLHDERAGRAIDAALGGGLREGLVVETRADAEVVVARFKHEKVGSVWCVLRSEAETNRMARARAPYGSTWLADAIGCAPEMRGAVDLLAAGWLICESAEEAERLSRPPRGASSAAGSAQQLPAERGARSYDCVTIDGRVFLRRGEIRSAASAQAPSRSGASSAMAPESLLPRAAFLAAQHEEQSSLGENSLVSSSLGRGGGGRAAAHLGVGGSLGCGRARHASQPEQANVADAVDAANAAERAARDALAAAQAKADSAASEAASAAARAESLEAGARAAAERARAAAAVEAAARNLAAANAEAAAAARARSRRDRQLHGAQGQARASGGAGPAAHAGAKDKDEQAELRAQLRGLLGEGTEWQSAADLASELERTRSAEREAEASLSQLGHKRKRALAAEAADGGGAPVEQSHQALPRRHAQRVRRDDAEQPATGSGDVMMADAPSASTLATVAPDDDAEARARELLRLATAERAEAAKRKREDAASLRAAGPRVEEAETIAANAKRALESAKAKLVAARKAVGTLEQQQAAVRAVTAELEADTASTARVEAAARRAAEAAGALAHSPDDNACEGEERDDDEEDGGEAEIEYRRRGGRGATPAVAGASPARSLAAAMPGAASTSRSTSSRESLSRFSVRSTRLHDEAAGIAEQLASIEETAERLSAEPVLIALPQAVEALRAAQSGWKAARARADALSAELVEREAERQVAFETALATANAKLSSIFGLLSPGADATLELSTADDGAGSGRGVAVAALAEGDGGGGGGQVAAGPAGGLRAVARTRGQPWREFGVLSGGQQQLLSIAVHLALGESARPPLPLLLLDEIDSALDSRNVQRVADLLRARRGTTQAICVSLRLQLIERGSSLTGIFPLHGSAHSVTLALDGDADEDGEGTIALP